MLLNQCLDKNVLHYVIEQVLGSGGGSVGKSAALSLIARAHVKANCSLTSIHLCVLTQNTYAHKYTNTYTKIHF